MQKTIITIPEGIFHLSDYQKFESLLPWGGSFILDKTITGCGATTLFLSDGIPTILCSPRRELLYCKTNAPQFKGKVFMFRDADKAGADVIDLENEMIQYVYQCNVPFMQMTPKILTTYDSFKHVVQRLCEANCFDRFRIIVDEAQALFTDAAFKGGVEIEFLQNLMHSNRVIFLSATPYIEEYLDQIDYFKGLPYVKLEWPESTLHPTNIEKRPYYRGSVIQTATKIIEDYRHTGYFAEKMVNGVAVRSTQAVFFLNNVRDIVSIIKKCSLSPKETNIICANQDRNTKRLKQLGHSLGHAPQNGEQHKTFTFATKCSFEGTDFYSPCAYTYIFSDINQKNLALDISLDLPQIMGRQRLSSNPFRYDATFFYKVDMDFSDKKEQEFMADISHKDSLTKKWIKQYEDCSDQTLRTSMAMKLRNSPKGNDYVAVVDDTVSGEPKVVFNTLEMYNEIRAWEIQKGQYINGCQVMRSVDEATIPISNVPELASFLNDMTGSFENQMRVYCEFLSAYPQHRALVESLPQISMDIKRYYSFPGPNVIKSSSYIEANIRRHIETANQAARIREKAEHRFVKGQFYTLAQVKASLQEIYQELGIDHTAKASQLDSLLPCESKKMTVNGKRENGYLIL